MKTIKYMVLALALFASTEAIFANPAYKPNKVKTTTVLLRLNCTVEPNGVVKDNAGTIIGKLNANGTVTDNQGNIIGSKARIAQEK